MSAASYGPLLVLLAALVAWLLVPPRARVPRPVPAPGADVAFAGVHASVDRSPLRRARPLLAALVAVAGWVVLAGHLGLLAGVAGAVGTWVVLGRTEPPSVRLRRERLARDLPLAVDLVGSCLRLGAAPESALRLVGEEVGGPVEEELGQVGHRLALGVDPERVWRELAGHPQLGPLGRSVARAHASGASVAVAVTALAEELRARERAVVEERARGVEVRAAAPLGLCFLPAFVLLGVVPMVVGIATSMALFG